MVVFQNRNVGRPCASRTYVAQVMRTPEQCAALTALNINVVLNGMAFSGLEGP